MEQKEGQPKETEHLVFVYGSLKKGFSNHGWFGKKPNFIREDKLTGGFLVSLGAFPGLIHGTGEVQGELYKVSTDIMHNLDRLEGHPSFYRREKVKFGDDEAWVYFLSPRCEKQSVGLPIVPNGKW